jgi:hypothetical protein
VRRKDWRPFSAPEAAQLLQALGEVESAEHPHGNLNAVVVKYKYREKGRDPVKVSAMDDMLQGIVFDPSDIR